MIEKSRAIAWCFSLLATSAGFISCVDNEKDFFDGEKMKQIYEQSFPVKDIDPEGDWTMSQSVAAHVSVDGEFGVDNTIRIFNANPLVAENGAILLAEGIANQEKTFDVAVDCSKAQTTLFVAKVDKHGRYLVQPVAIENGEIKAHFGDEITPTRSVSRSEGTSDFEIPQMTAPYTAGEIREKKDGAMEIKSGWDLGAAPTKDGDYAQKVFKQSVRWFRIDGTFEGTFTCSGTSGGAEAVKVIIPHGSTWVIKNSMQFSNITEFIVEDGGKIEIKENASLTLTNASYLTVLKGGKIEGDGKIQITNGSAGYKNYNAGTIKCSVLDFNGGPGGFYNYGEMELDKYMASTPGIGLVNHGSIEAYDIEGNNNTSIKNGCHIKVENRFQFGELWMGYTSEAICGVLSRNGSDAAIKMAAQSMLVCEKADLAKYIYGPTKGKALLKVDSIIGNIGELPYSSFKITNNIICEIKDQTSKGTAKWEWSGFDWLVHQGLQNSATYCNPGKADFLLPEDDECIEEGYHSDEEEDDVELQNAVYSYAFEDNYPYAGDYDFNDVVLNVTLPVAGDDVEELKYTIDLRAVGATKQLGAGLRIKGIKKTDVEEVRFGKGASERAGSLDNSRIFENVAFETNDSELVIPLFGDVHYVYGYKGAERPMLNTGNVSLPLTDIYTLEVIIKLDDDISVPSPTKDLDFFIAYQGLGNKRTEIHLNRFNSPTANGQLAGDELLEVMQAVNNTWALCVPDKFVYPKETVVITEAYAGFAEWAHKQDTDNNWYGTATDADKVMNY